EKDGEGVSDEERVNRVFRAVHTIKGGSGFFELSKIGELAHHAENVLALIRSQNLAPSPDCVAILLHAVDRLTEMVHNPATSNHVDIVELVQELKDFSDHRDRGKQKNSEYDTSSPPSGSRAIRILLVEDDFTNRLLLQKFLSRYGECHIAVNGREAVEAFGASLESQQRYDLICMDILMPEMNGREAVRKMRSLEQARGIPSSRGAKIIMITSVRDIREVFRCFEDLCDEYLLKPVDLARLELHLKALEFTR
ncbi:MAG: response regulator, partial [Terracidiphilus sp.]